MESKEYIVKKRLIAAILSFSVMLGITGCGKGPGGYG